MAAEDVADARVGRGRAERPPALRVGRDDGDAALERAPSRRRAPSGRGRRPRRTRLERGPFPRSITARRAAALVCEHAARASRATARSSNRSFLPPISWYCSWPLPGDQDDVPGARPAQGSDDRFGPVRDHGARRPVSRTPASISARIAAGSSERGLSDVSTTSSASERGDPAHLRALAAVAVAAAAEDDVHAPAARGASARQVPERALERARLVRVVDEDREAARVRDALQAARDARDGRERRGDRGRARCRARCRRHAAARRFSAFGRPRSGDAIANGVGPTGCTSVPSGAETRVGEDMRVARAAQAESERAAERQAVEEPFAPKASSTLTTARPFGLSIANRRAFASKYASKSGW